MNYTDKLENISVLGAAGKMGSGILLLTALEVADQSLKTENRGKQFVINAIDLSSEALFGLMEYIRAQVLKAAEKKMVILRKLYEDRSDLIENGEIINQYINDVMLHIRPSLDTKTAYNSGLVFEAIKEDPELKAKVLSDINNNTVTEPWFFTNTSSIPITELDNKAGLGGRLLGVHFYNPPAIQKLVEMIEGKNTRKELVDFAQQFAKNLRKVVVPSNDFAGFIGNGHFMRDAQYGIEKAEELASDMSLAEAILVVNRISQDWLVRPMGIFQLIDYVGIDVCQYIMSVMNPYLEEEDLHCSMLDDMLSKHKIAGGQKSNGSQKDGFLKYERNSPVAVFDPGTGKYVDIASVDDKVNKYIGNTPASMRPWKALLREKDKDGYFSAYFTELKGVKSQGSNLAVEYALRSKEIGQNLVSDKVARSEEDVNRVLLTGFYHAYGPINDYLS